MNKIKASFKDVANLYEKHLEELGREIGITFGPRCGPMMGLRLSQLTCLLTKMLCRSEPNLDCRAGMLLPG